MSNILQKTWADFKQIQFDDLPDALVYITDQKFYIQSSPQRALGTMQRQYVLYGAIRGDLTYPVGLYVVFDSLSATSARLWFYDGNWVEISGSGGGTTAVSSFVINGQTYFPDSSGKIVINRQTFAELYNEKTEEPKQTGNISVGGYVDGIIDGGGW